MSVPLAVSAATRKSVPTDFNLIAGGAVFRGEATLNTSGTPSAPVDCPLLLALNYVQSSFNYG